MRSYLALNKLALWLSYLSAAILVLLPFHAFLTVWLNSIVHHYTVLRLWKEFILVIILGGCIYLLVVDGKLRQKLFSFWVARLIGVYSLLYLVWGFIALEQSDASTKAVFYGLLVNLRFLIFFLAIWLIATKSSWLKDRWQKILLGPAILVAAIAMLQYLVLPYDFLRHFGYSESTIFPYETINHNINHIRAMSTLRGANPLGAYLLLPVSAMSILLIKNKKNRREGILLLAGLLLALVFSFSRSAWIGAGLSILTLAWLAFTTPKAKKILGITIAILAVAGALSIIFLRNNNLYQNTFFHTESRTKIKISSNSAHAAAFKSAVKDIYHQPLGRGVGTAGPESVYNNHPARIAENYFLQVGQETGLMGMALFISILAIVAKLLWEKKDDPLALCLLVSLIGITFINLLSHAWTDDTLAYIWWGLAGLTLATPLAKSKHKSYD